MLKSLDVIGFKSFADKTSFAFSPGITGVVGPNGSGKSNVVDAVKWILGNQSAKSLRGKEMTDVIFNGSTGRKGAGFAEATLTFDNSTGYLPTEHQEVKIGRRIWSSGDAEYLLNNQTARLRDIKDMLSGSGIGASAYCIIEQGRVDQILQSNPAKRRAVFEEAAGISRFKGRKAEAERKLERVDQNLRRLTDIVDSLEAQLVSRRSQAAKAAKYREISEELKELWLGLSADEYRHYNTLHEDFSRQLKKRQAEQQEFTESQNLIDEQLKSLDQSIGQIEDQLRDVEREAGQFRQKITAHQTTIRHQAARRQEMDTETIRLRKQRQIAQNRAAEAQREMERTKTVLNEQTSDFETLKLSIQQKQNAVEAQIQTLKTLRQRAEALRQRLLTETRAQAEAKSRLENITDQQTHLDSTLRQTQQELVEREQEIEELENKLLQQNEKVRAATEMVQQADASVSNLVQERDNLRQTLSEMKQNITRLREERSAARARKTVLEDLESRQEGLGIGAQDILERSESTDISPWNRIQGSVADRFEVDLEHAPLVELALGSKASLILIDELGPLVDYLKHAKSPITGRVGFRSIPEFTAEESQSESLDDEPGVVARADRLVKTTDSDAALATELLGNTWVVESLPVALRLLRQTPKNTRQRFITLQGELLETDGTLFVGTMSQESAILSRRSELKRLKVDLTKYDDRIAFEETRVGDVESQIADHQQQLDESRTNLQHARESLNTVKNLASGSEGELNRRQQKLESLRETAQSINTRLTELEAERGEVEEQLSTFATRLEDLQSQISEIEAEEEKVESQLHEHDGQLADDKLELAKQEERVISLKQSFERLVDDLKLREQQQADAHRRYEQICTANRDAMLTVLNFEAELSELHLEEQDLSLRAEALLVAKDEARLQRGRLQHQENDLRGERRKVDEEIHQLEIKLRDINYQIQGIAERIEEEYQLVIQDVVDRGDSAIRTYLNNYYEAVAAERPEESNEEQDETGDQSDDQEEPQEQEENKDPNELTVESLKQAVVVQPREGEEKLSQDSAETSAEQNPEDPAELVYPEELDYETIHAELEERVNRLRRKRKMMGAVDTDSLADLDELEQRYSALSTQLEDLVEARSSLEEIIRKINTESKRLFQESFASIRDHFRELFRKLFGGGEGDIILEDPNDILECGVEIVARPPGKELRSISLLSGGERTMTAVAMLMSIFKSKPSPFCILDEVDAALDEANIDRFINVLKEFQESTQFIIITHRKPTMTVCDVLYGVTMEQSGVSKRMSVKFDEVNEHGEFQSSEDSGNVSSNDAA
ncbi:MAG: chromosome segregation protein SMC [Planctomycetaceae bacterium]|nr:chromosome segregation protein SMC [Planctomycetaceae bacterium]